MQNKSKHIIILATLAAIFILATLFSGPTNNFIEGSGDPVFPDLLARVNDVTFIKIEKNDASITLTRDNELWTIKENDHYPAAIDKVRQLVLGIGNMKRIEPKTGKPENYEQLGLRDVSKKGSQAVHITLIAGSDKKLADLIIGNSKPAGANDTGKYYYIRTKDDAQSWLAEAKLPDQWQPKDWLDIDILEINRDRIQQVKVTHPDGELVYIHRDSPSLRDFILDSLKPGEKVTAPYEVNNIATTFTKMTFDDVVNAANAKTGDTPLYSAVLQTFDGLEITFQPFAAGEKFLARYSARFDPDVAKTWGEKLAQQDKDKATPETQDPVAAAHGGASTSTAALKSADEVKKEADSYNKRWQGWMYQLPDFRVKNIGKTKADLLKKENATSPH